MEETLEKINLLINSGKCNKLVNKLVNTLVNILVDEIKLNKIIQSDENVFTISKLIFRYIGYGDIKFSNDNLLILLDYINWYYPTIIQHSTYWNKSDERFGYYFTNFIKFANKNNKKINGLNKYETLFSMVMAILYYKDIDTEKLILSNKIKMPISMFKVGRFYDKSISDIDEYFLERNYDILIDL
jgi:hypothetical protein